jgi:hypothetical protein
MQSDPAPAGRHRFYTALARYPGAITGTTDGRAPGRRIRGGDASYLMHARTVRTWSTELTMHVMDGPDGYGSIEHVRTTGLATPFRPSTHHIHLLDQQGDWAWKPPKARA